MIIRDLLCCYEGGTIMEFKHCLDILRKRIWLIILLPFLITAIYTTVKVINYKPVYEAYSTLYIINKSDDESVTYENIIINERLVKDYSELIKSKSVTNIVLDELAIEDLTHGALSNKINVSLINDTRILEIKVQDIDPKRAKLITDKVSEVFIRKAIELMHVDNINIIDYAHVPENPLGNRTVYNSFICFLVSIPIIIGFLLLIEYMNNNINSIDDVEHYLALDVLGIIPSFKIN